MSIERILSLTLGVIFLTIGCAHVGYDKRIKVPSELPPTPLWNPIEVALVLSGGGARGITHLGAIEIFEANGVPIDLIVGTSAGSLIGALYADNPDALALKEKIIGLKKSDLIDTHWRSVFAMLWTVTGPIHGDALKDFLLKNLRAKEFHELKIPLAVVTTDLKKARSFVIRSGPIIPALHASCAVPLLFSPVEIYGKTLVDGGVSSPVPVEVAKKFSPRLVIAVDVGTAPERGEVNNTYQLAYRSLHISYFYLSKWQTRAADIVIRPDVNGFGMFDDYANEKLYEAGQKAALAALPAIKEALQKLNLSRALKSAHSVEECSSSNESHS